MMMYKSCFFIVTVFLLSANITAQKVNYSPTYFGPNANPVPQFTDAKIPNATTVKLSGNYYFGFGDQTGNVALSIEIPLLQKRISIKGWVNFLEYYKVTNAVYAKRDMRENKLSGSAMGDFYVQTRVNVLSEKKYAPDITVNITLKTASGTAFKQRRYFDTPGYYFDAEIGKSVDLKNKAVEQIRFVLNVGFYCWETTNSTQNDAPMYGGKFILSNRLFDFENDVSGYYGWIKNGDAPLVYSSKLTFKQNRFAVFAQYQYGIIDFPYHHIQLGTSVFIPELTPKWKLKGK